MRRPLFREVNERIRALNTRFGVAGDYRLLCECGRADCMDRIDVPAHVYETARQEEAVWFVAPGHERLSEERLVSDGRNFRVVTPKRSLEPAIAEAPAAASVSRP
jgi:hypothetical protein